MLEKIKLSLRLTGNAFDSEITDLIAAALLDLGLVGIIPPEPPPNYAIDPLIIRAVILYCKSEFYQNAESERYRKAYDHLKCTLSLSGDYNGGNSNAR